MVNIIYLLLTCGLWAAGLFEPVIYLHRQRLVGGFFNSEEPWVKFRVPSSVPTIDRGQGQLEFTGIHGYHQTAGIWSTTRPNDFNYQRSQNFITSNTTQMEFSLLTEIGIERWDQYGHMGASPQASSSTQFLRISNRSHLLGQERREDWDFSTSLIA